MWKSPIQFKAGLVRINADNFADWPDNNVQIYTQYPNKNADFHVDRSSNIIHFM